MFSATSIKYNNLMIAKVTNGHTPGNRLKPMMLKYGYSIETEAFLNMLQAENNTDGIRKNRALSGTPGRNYNGELASAYYTRLIDGRTPEVRIGNRSKLFKYHEFGTRRTGWGRGILRANTLQNALNSHIKANRL